MQPKEKKNKQTNKQTKTKQGFFWDLRVVWFQKVILINWFFFFLNLDINLVVLLTN